jgi:hypothetical protein
MVEHCPWLQGVRWSADSTLHVDVHRHEYVWWPLVYVCTVLDVSEERDKGRKERTDEQVVDRERDKRRAQTRVNGGAIPVMYLTFMRGIGNRSGENASRIWEKFKVLVAYAPGFASVQLERQGGGSKGSRDAIGRRIERKAMTPASIFRAVPHCISSLLPFIVLSLSCVVVQCRDTTLPAVSSYCPRSHCLLRSPLDIHCMSYTHKRLHMLCHCPSQSMNCSCHVARDHFMPFLRRAYHLVGKREIPLQHIGS